MICPYCAKDVADGSQRHHGCEATNCNDKPFPPLYLDHHGGEGRAEPIVLSVVGFSGHGKTVFLCALFDYLDDHLTYLWRNNFHNLVLDQESLSMLNFKRDLLRGGRLPPPTESDFLRPGIFRLTHMPHSAGNNGLPPLEDTTVLIYDPPGEAFETEDKIVKFASFVKRSSCVLFLVDLTALGNSIAHEMAELLDTYVLGMRRMGIEQQSQHLIVVYTKSDEIKVSVPEFTKLLEREPWLSDYLSQQRPATLANPHEHFKVLENVSGLLEEFTWSDLRGARFIHIARDWFASVSFTAVSSLGAAPERREVQDENGAGAGAAPQEGDDAPLDLDDGDSRQWMRLTSEMSPRGVADPLLYVLAKSLKEPVPEEVEELPPPGLLERMKGWLNALPLWGVAALILGSGTLTVVTLLGLLALAWPGGAVNRNAVNGATNVRRPTNANTSANSNKPARGVAAPKGMAYVPGGEFIMGSANGDGFERPPHSVSVEPFYIDLYEVTCADYAQFVEQMGHAPPPGWVGGQFPQGADRRPVTGITWDDAVAYAKWAGKRLPTEEEWEFAARGTDGRVYPWGGEWRAGVANAGDAGRQLADVGSFTGVSPYGVYDMAGNAWEWTAGELHPYPGGQLPPVPRGELKVVRGGSWQEEPGQSTATYRGYLLARGGKDYSATGFRCAQGIAVSSVAGASDVSRR